MILIIDGANFLHRARSGFQLGDFNVAYNFFRGLRSLVEKMKPTRIIFTLEGSPKRQLALLPEYKANRAIDMAKPGAEEKQKSLADFRRQKDLIVDLLKKHFPISVVQHPDFEGDDVVYNLVKVSSVASGFTIVSTDTDFIQILQERLNVKLYNPVTKAYVEPPAGYDYVLWKALRGDGSDNIPGLVTEAAALKMVSSDLTGCEELDSFRNDRAKNEQLGRNYSLIKLHAWSGDEAIKMTSSAPTRDWDAVKAQLDAWAFKSITKEGAWAKFVQTFDPLWG